MGRPSRTLPSLVASVAAGALALAGCGGGGSGETHYESTTPVEPTAGTWRTWIVPDVLPFRRPAPPPGRGPEAAAEMEALRARAAARTIVQTTNVDFWNGGTARRWNEHARSLVATNSINPPKAARLYALASFAMYDAMVAAWDVKFHYRRVRPSGLANPPAVHGPQSDTPSYVSERAAMSAAAAKVLAFYVPASAAATASLLQSAFDADLDACVHFPTDVEQGRLLGEAIGQAVLAYAATDHGDDAQPAYVPSGVIGRWQPTPNALAPALLPGWGLVKTLLLPHGSAFRPGAPPAYGSGEWDLRRDEVLLVSQTLTPERTATALFWADGAGTATPPGHWNEIATAKGVSHGLNECRMTRMYAALGAAQHDAFVACWDCKYAYDVERPITTIRRDVGGEGAWAPLIATPPFPTYPSGHSTTSGAASQVLGYFFPDDALELAADANDAKDSRLFGGIHFAFDNDVGLDLGRSIGTLAVFRLAQDGAD